jgi:AraC-like DNA-binding protein
MTNSGNRLTQKGKVATTEKEAHHRLEYPSFAEHLYEGRKLCLYSSTCHHDYFLSAYISVGHFRSKHASLDASINLNYSTDSIFLWFQRRGRAMIQSSAHSFLFSDGQCNLIRLKSGDIKIRLEDPESEGIALYFDEESFRKLLPQNGIVVEKIYHRSNFSSGFCVSEHNFQVRWELEHPLNEMMESIKSNHRYCAMTVLSSGIQLLSHFFRQLEVADKGFCGFQKLRGDKINRVKSLIDGHIESPLSIAELAHRVGTNETYLKKQFKESYGTTVHGYLLRIRMEKAIQLLSEGHPVYDVAWKVGYKHATHFTHAFKKHFGYPPGKLK